jgi:alkanesulfonate monooxygenase SsuD/methylene tetrahydromethanopterin reductase-like flavin-dependent oxidoreductase (luciferase family)
VNEAPAWVTHPWVAEGQRRVRFGVFRGPSADLPALVDWAQTVEGLGFDSFWVSDHTILHPYDPWTALAALAVRTRRLRLGPLVNCVYYRPPALLARMAADVDRLSGGRLVLGLGAGDYAREFAQLGLPYPPLTERQAALAETVEIVRGLWGGAPFTFDGAHFRVAEAAVRPGPAQASRVPLLIAGGGERVTLGQVARYADASNVGPSGVTGSAWGPEEVRRKYAALREHCARIGRPYESVLRTYFVGVVVAESAEGVQTKLDASEDGVPRVEAERARGMPRALRTHYNLPSPRPIPRLIVAGTPEEITAYFRALVDAGVRYFILAGHDPEPIRLLAERVIPQFGDA